LNLKKILIVIFTATSIVHASCDNGPSYVKDQNKAFNTIDWKKTPEQKRYQFADDIIKNKVLIGKTRAEVVDMLGPPNPYSENLNSLTYVLSVGGRGVDLNKVYTLEIKFDKSGYATDVFSLGD
jgi:hypothetical protein